MKREQYSVEKVVITLVHRSMNMGFVGIHHTGIIVQNLDRSIYFYHDVLGTQFVSEPSPWFDGDDLAVGVGVPGASLRQVNLSLGGSQFELLEYGNRPQGDDEPAPQNRLGSMHLAFRVDDIAATRDVLAARGIHFLSDINVVDSGVLAGWRWVYLHDPDGITIELVEEQYTETEKHREAIERYLGNRPPLDTLIQT
jgi:catechol 2,3-dioxygenase-like lactoylglutathione lyase family enzyme